MIPVLVAAVSGCLLLAGTLLTVTVTYLLGQQKESREDRTELRERVETLESNERIRDDYILRLRQHIADELPPPPPPWPEDLRRT